MPRKRGHRVQKIWTLNFSVTLIQKDAKPAKNLISAQKSHGIQFLDTSTRTNKAGPSPHTGNDPTPCRSHIYRYPAKAKEAIASILQDLKERDIKEKSIAAWLSPIVLINKPSGEKRMCPDYRKVDKQLTTDIHPLPNLEELVENMAGNQYYATLDMKDACYQVLLDEESRDLTTFSERIKLYRFKRLPFGLNCSASIFVRQLQAAMARLLKQGWIKSYLDDIIASPPVFNSFYRDWEKYLSTWKQWLSS